MEKEKKLGRRLEANLECLEREEAPGAQVVAHSQGDHVGTVVQSCHLHLLRRKLNLRLT